MNPQEVRKLAAYARHQRIGRGRHSLAADDAIIDLLVAILDTPGSHDDCAACDEGEPMPHDYRRPLGGARVVH